MSNHICPVIEVKLEKHPNADSLSLIRTDGYTLVVKTADWQDEELGVHVPPDYVVPNNEQFAFLNGSLRIKPRKFRDIYSDGILIKAPPGAKVGDNMMDHFGIVRYEPPMELSFNGNNESGPSGVHPKYDVESYKKYNRLISSGEEVLITEKLHGASARFLWQKDRMWVGSRTNWKANSDKDPWWQALSQNAWIESWCIHHEGLCLYGEIFGRVQNLKYGCTANEIRFAIFDILDGREWMEYVEARKISPSCIWVPELYRGPFDEKLAIELSEGDSSVLGAKHCREGVVIQPIPNRNSDEIGRVKLKIVSNRYLSKE